MLRTRPRSRIEGGASQLDRGGHAITVAGFARGDCSIEDKPIDFLYISFNYVPLEARL